MKRIFIMRGVSGAGKTTWWQSQFPNQVINVCSADAFFMKDGKYEWDLSKFSEAYGKCLRDFVETVSEKDWSTVVVDNTNIPISDLAPYYALAEAFGHEVKIVTIVVNPLVAAARGVHGVSDLVTRAKHDFMMEETKRFPARWKHRIVNLDDRMPYTVTDE